MEQPRCGPVGGVSSVTVPPQAVDIEVPGAARVEWRLHRPLLLVSFLVHCLIFNQFCIIKSTALEFLVTYEELTHGTDICNQGLLHILYQCAV